MSAREIEMMGAAFICGLPLGALFFGGLWWTIGRATASSLPAVWFLVSMLFRPWRLSLSFTGSHRAIGAACCRACSASWRRVVPYSTSGRGRIIR